MEDVSMSASSTLSKRRYDEIRSALIERVGQQTAEDILADIRRIMKFSPEESTYTKEKGKANMEARKKRAAELGVSLWVYGGGKASSERKKTPCISCGLRYNLSNSDKCSYCDPNKRRLEKQTLVKEFLDKNGHGDYTSYDRAIDESVCGRERPDFMWDLKTHYMILEVDENQHASRPCECEQTRMINIAQSLGGPPVYFIRYNPDDYKVKGEKQTTTPGKRLKNLVEWLERVKAYTPETIMTDGMVNVTHLYFDEYEPSDGFKALVGREGI